MKPKIAVILFPGNNCEQETKRAAESAGMDADIIRWNSKPDLEKYDGYIIPGGWSYEDRIRAGVISAKDPIMEKIKKESKKGKVVLGICNGAQVIVETGLIPGLKDKIEMALAPNINPKVSGFYCTWSYIKAIPKRKTAFNQTLKTDEIIPMPIAHGEGRFTTKHKELLKELIANDMVMFQYCDEKGNIIDKFPINPNGAMHNIAGLCNKEGNVMAIMPHPERASWKRQLPDFQGGSFPEAESAGPGRAIFESIKQYIEHKKQ